MKESERFTRHGVETDLGGNEVKITVNLEPSISKLLDRLADYEDTGLLPKEIEFLKEKFDVVSLKYMSMMNSYAELLNAVKRLMKQATVCADVFSAIVNRDE